MKKIPLFLVNETRKYKYSNMVLESMLKKSILQVIKTVSFENSGRIY